MVTTIDISSCDFETAQRPFGTGAATCGVAGSLVGPYSLHGWIDGQWRGECHFGARRRGRRAAGCADGDTSGDGSIVKEAMYPENSYTKIKTIMYMSKTR